MHVPAPALRRLTSLQPDGASLQGGGRRDGLEAPVDRAANGAEPAEAALVRLAGVGDRALKHIGVEHRGDRLGRRGAQALRPLPRPASEGERLLRVLAVQRERERELGARLEEG